MKIYGLPNYSAHINCKVKNLNVVLRLLESAFATFFKNTLLQLERLEDVGLPCSQPKDYAVNGQKTEQGPYMNKIFDWQEIMVVSHVPWTKTVCKSEKLVFPNKTSHEHHVFNQHYTWKLKGSIWEKGVIF